jgi:hypothetical protein
MCADVCAVAARGKSRVEKSPQLRLEGNLECSWAGPWCPRRQPEGKTGMRLRGSLFLRGPAARASSGFSCSDSQGDRGFGGKTAAAAAAAAVEVALCVAANTARLEQRMLAVAWKLLHRDGSMLIVSRQDSYIRRMALSFE